MQVKRKLRWLLMLVILVAFGVWLEPTRVVWGWLRGEAFYEGRPTSWWEHELANWYLSFFVVPDELPPGQQIRTEEEFETFGHRSLVRTDDYLDTIRDFIGVRSAIEPKLKLLEGHAEAAPVLTALLEHPSADMRKMARHGLRRIRNEKPKEP